MSSPQATDEAALRALVEAYAAGVDARRYDAVAALFTAGGVLATSSTPGGAVERETVGRDAIARALHGLDRYEATLHVVANHVASVDGDRATGETGCLAHHLERADDGGCTDRVLAIRYHDSFERTAAGWAISRRELRLLWIERHPVER